MYNKRKKISVLAILFVIIFSIVMSETTYATTYGARTGSISGYNTGKCGTFAFGMSTPMNFYFDSTTNQQTWNACSSVSELIAAAKYHIKSCCTAQYSSSCTYQGSTYAYTINESTQYKMAFKLGYYDDDGISGISIDLTNNDGDSFDYHWRYLGANGIWYEKVSLIRRICPGNNTGGVSPYSLTWYMNTQNTDKKYSYSGYNYKRINW